MMKRVYDLAGVISSKVNVYLNNKKIEIKSFSDYVDLYFHEEKPKIIDSAKNARWLIIIK